ncbi:MAG: glycosyltransferase [Rhodobacteraceae bacterium]|nr:glycosyltransferase [Paracoccaceae bacterium]
MRHAPDDLAASIGITPRFGAGRAAPCSDREVAILLALCNGGRFIEEQLDSLAAQTHSEWRLTVSDDGSHDDGAERVRRWAARHPDRQIRMLSGPKAGFARNFLHLLAAVEPGTRFASFADQDDVWLPGKLARAVDALSKVPEREPALYCARSWICDARLGNLHRSERWPLPPSFRNALVQNIAAGNTIVVNRAALRLLQAAARRVEDVAAHDWWAYQVVTGAGGTVIHDSAPSVLYRQHDANVIGANRGLRAHLRRFWIVVRGHLRSWNDLNIAALLRAAPYLTPENRALVEAFAAARAAPPSLRPARLRRLGLHRQSRIGTGCLWIVAVLGLF